MRFTGLFVIESFDMNNKYKDISRTDIIVPLSLEKKDTKAWGNFGVSKKEVQLPIYLKRLTLVMILMRGKKQVSNVS